MKNRIWTLTGALALLAVIGKYYAMPAIAQTVRAAIVKNIDERGRNPYAVNVDCSPAVGPASSCTAQATQVPAGMRLVVENINLIGLFQSPNTTTTRTTLWVNTGQNRAHEVTGGIYTNPSGNQRYYALNQNLIDYVEAGEIPSIEFDVTGSVPSTVFFGTITGYLVNLNN
jgi:hypothetical protein